MWGIPGTPSRVHSGVRDRIKTALQLCEKLDLVFECWDMFVSNDDGGDDNDERRTSTILRCLSAMETTYIHRFRVY